MLAIQKLGRSLLAAYAYDNLDIDLKSAKPTVESAATPSLQHLTTGLLFALPHGITREDLRCSRYLWERSRLNLSLPDNRTDLAPLPEFENLLQIHAQHRTVNASGMTHRDRWNAYKFMHDLVYYGPEFFHRYCALLEVPTVIDQVPLTKTRTIPARAMNVSNSSVSGNLDAMRGLLLQSGFREHPQATAAAAVAVLPSSVPADTDIEMAPQSSSKSADEALDSVDEAAEYAILFHGDLGTGERIAQCQRLRSIEKTPYLRYQFSIYVLGLFHLKMACADALWRIFIHPFEARSDGTSVKPSAGQQNLGVPAGGSVGKPIGNTTRGYRYLFPTGHHRCGSWLAMFVSKPVGTYRFWNIVQH